MSPEQWLSWSRKSVVPLWAIGKPASELESALVVLAPTREDQEIRWQDTSIDGSHVTLVATVRADRIANVTVSTEIDSHVTPVWQRLRKLFGAPDSATTDEDTYRWRWRHAPRVEASTFVGDQPSPRPRVTGPLAATPKMPSDPGFPLSIMFGAE